MNCELCNPTKESVLWQNSQTRVILVPDPDYPGFCRVIWHAHVKEMTDLSQNDQMVLMKTVFAAENAIRTVLNPDKVNLASLGNVVPHLHWHVIPRYRHDRHFPNPIWGIPCRENLPVSHDNLARLLASQLEKAMPG